MADFEKMYYKLFNSMTDVLELIREKKYLKAEETIISAQRTAEEMYIDEDAE